MACASLRRQSIPVVAIDAGRACPGVAHVRSDLRGGGRLATDHLLDLGHRRILHVAGPADWSAADERAAGWHRALSVRGLEVPEVVRGDWSAASGHGLAPTVLRDDATAVFVANDQMAIGLLRGLVEAGCRVPDDCSVVGYGDRPGAAHLQPPLTTVSPDFVEVGRHSLRLLAEFVHHDADPGTRVVRPRLVVRDSTAAPGRGATSPATG